MLKERSRRAEAASSSRFPQNLPDLPTMTLQPPHAPITRTSITTTQQSSEQQQRPPQEVQQATPQDSKGEDTRDPGVTDAVWHELQQAKLAAAAGEAEHARLVQEEEQKVEAIRQAELELAALKKAEQEAKEDEEKRRIEAERLKRELERRKREAELGELERQRREREKEREREKVAQKKLRDLGVCEAGFRWIKQAGGYRCAGGFHFVSDAQLGL
jgi:hypothetical protein